MDNKTLVTQLVQAGLLGDDVGRKLLQEASLIARPVEDLIYERRIVPEDALLRLKSQVLGVPSKSVDPESIGDNLLKLIPEEMVRNYKVIPLEARDDLFVAGMVNPDDEKAQEALRFVGKQHKVNLGVYLIPMSLWEFVLRKYSPYRGEVEAAVHSLSSVASKKMSFEQKIISVEGGVAAGSDDAPIIRIVASTLKEAVWQKASDIHIEPQRNRLRIRFRLDGDLQEVASMPVELHQAIVSRVKVLSNLKIDETRIPQDGRFRTVLMGHDIDFRVATFPTPVGEKVAIRVLDPTVGLKGLEELGISNRNQTALREAIAKPYGMVLITGPTGSGKTTTLYSLMQILNRDEVNIVSLEDPVEYYMDGLNQSQVHPEIGYDFASGLRQILRQDPDVIMVGEIRDNETAGLAIHAALTGHVVLSTLHTNNAAGVIPRLIDMGVEPFLIPAALNVMVGQRLVPRLCQVCKKAKTPTPEIAAIIEGELKNIPADAKAGIDEQALRVYESPGCDACKGKGVSGRIALFEMLEMTREMEKVVASRQGEGAIIEEAKHQHMVTLRQDGVLKALGGLVSIETVLRETETL
ncbi:MAG: GspE/PulE family protein [Candidatus Paceibacterota bacterium]|jgi:type IV pilus assembly protein PilB